MQGLLFMQAYFILAPQGTEFSTDASNNSTSSKTVIYYLTFPVKCLLCHKGSFCIHLLEKLAVLFKNSLQGMKN